MPSAPAPGAKSSGLDFKKSLLNTFAISLDAGWSVAPDSSVGSRTGSKK
jgi:hypothetical protein